MDVASPYRVPVEAALVTGEIHGSKHCVCAAEIYTLRGPDEPRRDGFDSLCFYHLLFLTVFESSITYEEQAETCSHKGSKHHWLYMTV